MITTSINFARVPLEVGRDIVESMYGNIAGDAIPRYIATAGGNPIAQIKCRTSGR